MARGKNLRVKTVQRLERLSMEGLAEKIAQRIFHDSSGSLVRVRVLGERSVVYEGYKEQKNPHFKDIPFETNAYAVKEVISGENSRGVVYLYLQKLK